MLRINEIYADYSSVSGGAGGIVERADPVISWSAESGAPDSRQTKYRLRAFSGDAPLLDTGWVESPNQRARLPEGTLPEGEEARIDIEIIDNHGDHSAPEQCFLRNALISWDAAWIGDKGAKENSCVCLRKKFEVKPDMRDARLYIAGLGYCDIEINGITAYNDSEVLTPPFTDYSRRVNYSFITMNAMALREGENELRCTLASGWRQNTRIHDNKWLEKQAYSFEGDMELSAMLHILYADGSSEWIKTDETWDVGAGPIVTANIFDGTVYDARRELEYTKRADIMPAPGGRMLPDIVPPVAVDRVVTPKAHWPDGENAVVYDFGYNIAGVISFAVPENLNPGDEIRIAYSEELTEDGRLFRDTLRNAKAEDVYIASGDARDLAGWMPPFTYHGFRYARIEGLGALVPDFMSAVEYTNQLANRSSFTCGSALVTRIHEMCVDTERANMHSILTDCPQRDERMGWLNDATVRFEETPYNFNIGRMFPKVVRDILDVQAQNGIGAIGCTAPFIAGSVPADPVCSSFLVAGYEAAMHAGNLDIIREAYPGYAAWESCLLSRSENYIVNYSNYGDWAGPLYACVGSSTDDPGAVSAVTPGAFMSTGYSYYNCVLLEKFARWLGCEADAAKHAETARAIKTAMLEKWYDPATGKIATGSQACQAFALWLGIIPEKDRPLAAKLLNDDLLVKNLQFTTGNLCTRYIMDALTQNGYLETAWKLITKETYPSLGYMLQQEATTVWERFELMKNPNMNSHCHPMYGAVDYWLHAYIGGLKPTSFGWRTFDAAPVMPEGLMSAQSVLDTPMGEISLRWTKRYGGAHLQLNVPFGATARVLFCGREYTAESGFHAYHADLS